VRHSDFIRLCLAVMICMAHGGAAAFDLVIPDDMHAEAMARPIEMKSAPTPNAPAIEILQPNIDGPLTGPVDILISWTAKDGASVDPTSLRVLYGMLRIDITSRLMPYAKVTADGLEARSARLPAGKHRLFICITDSLARESRREFVIEVASK